MQSSQKPIIRAGDLGVPFDGIPGPLNAITDVAGVAVGHATLISGEGPLRVGFGPVRTGVTAILPRGRDSTCSVIAGWFALNGNGELTGTAWIDESGLPTTPILLTNTHSVRVVRDSAIAWAVKRGDLPAGADRWQLPVVGETYDGWLNDINGFHVKPEHVFTALDSAARGPVTEGNVGGGTGNICYQYKGGIGTSSRRFAADGPNSGEYTVGALAQANHGLRRQLCVGGVNIGAALPLGPGEAIGAGSGEAGSIIIALAVDVPLLPHQLKAVAKRAALGLARTGSVAGIDSGDIFIAFSTANLTGADPSRDTLVTMHGLSRMSDLYEAAVQATEEAIVNALVAAAPMTGINKRFVPALPREAVRELMAGGRG